MSRKDKQQSKNGQKIVMTRNKGGRARAADLSINPDEDRPCTGLPELTGHITAECYNLAVEFEELFNRLGLRKVELDNLFKELNEQIENRSLSEGHLIRCFDGAVLGPLRDICQKLTKLQIETAQSEQSQVRSLIRSAVGADESNFGKILRAFEKKIEEILGLNRQDVNNRQAVKAILEETNRCAADAERIKRLIVGRKLESGRQSGLEQELDELIKQTVRELADDKSVLRKGGLEKYWERAEQLERLLGSYCQAKKNFAAVRKEYDVKARRFFDDKLDLLGLYKGEWYRQKETIRYAEEFFKAAGLNPFELSDKLSGIDRKNALTMPDQEERAALEAQTPSPFPQFFESRVEERGKKIIEEIMTAMEDFVRREAVKIREEQRKKV